MQIQKHYPRNELGRDFIIGDLHGCFDAFQDLLADIGFDRVKDRMFSVGDLIDRGAKNMDCLRLISESWFYAVRGNHEDMMIQSILQLHSSSRMWFQNGGMWAQEVDPDELKGLCKEADKLPYAMTIDIGDKKIGVCHANPPSDWRAISEGYSDHLLQSLVWSRTKIQSTNTEDIQGIDYVVVGHTPVSTHVSFGNVLYIDTGCVFDGQKLLNGRVLKGLLTCVELKDVPYIIPKVTWKIIREQLKKQGKGLHE